MHSVGPMKRAGSLIAVLLLTTGATVFMAGARLSFFSMNPAENGFVISWRAEVEDGVAAYELFRKTPNTVGQAVLVTHVNARGHNVLYSYTDNAVYKAASEQVTYTLEAVLSDGSRQMLRQESRNYTSTAVRRTWGSIKAMFQ